MPPFRPWTSYFRMFSQLRSCAKKGVGILRGGVKKLGKRKNSGALYSIKVEVGNRR